MKTTILFIALCIFAFQPVSAESAAKLRDTVCNHSARADAIRSLMEAESIEITPIGDGFVPRIGVTVLNTPGIKEALKAAYDQEVAAFFKAKAALEAFYQTATKEDAK